MNNLECTHNCNSKDPSQKPASGIQHILVFQQNGSGIKKVDGVKLYEKSPVHLAGKIHTAALKKALKRS